MSDGIPNSNTFLVLVRKCIAQSALRKSIEKSTCITVVYQPPLLVAFLTYSDIRSLLELTRNKPILGYSVFEYLFLFIYCYLSLWWFRFPSLSISLRSTAGFDLIWNCYVAASTLRHSFAHCLALLLSWRRRCLRLHAVQTRQLPSIHTLISFLFS